jgi:hypothetical protein
MTKSAGDIIHLLEASQPAGDISDAAVPDVNLHQDLNDSSGVSAEMAGGYFNVTSEKRSLSHPAIRFADTDIIDASPELGGVSFPLAHRQSVTVETAEGQSALDDQRTCRSSFASPTIGSAVRNSGEEVGLKDLAAEVQASPFHVSRMRKHGLDAPPKIYPTHHGVSPSEFRRVVRRPARPSEWERTPSLVEGRR